MKNLQKKKWTKLPILNAYSVIPTVDLIKKKYRMNIKTVYIQISKCIICCCIFIILKHKIFIRLSCENKP